MSGEGGLSPVTVVGLGPMGRAMAASLLRSGHPVTVWNRTEGRADDLIVRGATLAPTATAAVAASELTILSLTDYQAMYDILDPVAESSRPSAVLAGKVLVNLSSDTPDASRDAAGWAARHGASFVTGGVMVP
ncbi:6-phosphogluconate dehydrogenase, partial [Frankia casuarinae]|uniref:NAD(P)-binding domain-containing protein n=2 Tax=Frankia TaxID=1854 RepID=UPI000A2612D0